MAKFKVVKIYDGNTFEVEGWVWNGYSGKYVRAIGYTTPNSNQNFWFLPKQKLEQLLLFKEVELVNVQNMSNGVLSCRVLLNGTDIADYFPEYKIY